MSRALPLLFHSARWVRRIFLLLSAALLLGLIGLLVWSRMVKPAETPARFALDSDETVLVSKDPWIAFQPRDVDPVTGVIFYPDARTEPAAYAPILHSLAARGFLVVMTPMPLNLAVLAPDRAARVMTRFADIRHWIIAGHGLGGVVAAEFASRHTRELAGLMLWAASPGRFSDLSQSSLSALAIYAATTPADLEKSQRRLPAGTRFVPLAAADHWDFGDFAMARSQDLPSRESQQAKVLEAAQDFLEQFPRPSGTSDEP